MASGEDARAAARRIVEQVLADREAVADEVTPAPVAEEVEDDPRLEVLVDDAVEDLVADPAVDVPDAVSEARARARALVAEVLADHEARTAEAARTADLEQAGTSAAELEPTEDDEPELEPVAEGSPATDVAPNGDAPEAETAAEVGPESTSRLRARELVAAVLAEAEAREAAAAAAAAAEEAEAEAVRRAEAEAEAARVREAEAARELAAALAEETERELWADADRDVASRTQPLEQRDGDGGQPDDGPDPDETRPLSVAELAAAERAARGTDGEAEPDVSPERTAVIPVVAGATVASGGGAAATAAPRPAEDRPASAATEARPAPASEVASAPAEEGTVATGVLEAIVDPAQVGDPPRTGRWLLASILGAVTLAILFPLAIRALLDLVSLS